MHYVIAGLINCSQFTFALIIAQRLKEHLPDFTYSKISKTPEQWEKWLIRICRENEWYHIESPLIWRELGAKNGKKTFIGTINNFLSLCYDYYGVPREMLSAESFNKGEMEWFTRRTESKYFKNIKMEAKKKLKYRSRQVCITGAASQVAEILIMELLSMPIQQREDGLEIRLFDDPSKERKLEGMALDAKYCPGPSGFGNCRVAYSLKEAFCNIDLVIVLDAFFRKPKESLVKWLKRNRNAMCALGKALKMYAPPHCRVIIGSPSTQPLCYNATVLASFATHLHVRNIVAVTMDLGRELLKPLSLNLNIPLKSLYCPPVWGFVGLNKFIDLRRTLQNHFYKVPGKKRNLTLPQGIEEYELRTVECLIAEDDITKLAVKVENHKSEAYPQLGRWPCLAKATAIIDLLKLWTLKQEDGNGEILCLGVYSDGTFNIPQGLFWSQPVILKNGFWVPFPSFPIPRTIHFNPYHLFLIGIAALYRTKVKPRRYIIPKPVLIKKDTKKFNFQKLINEVGMPVIRTDADCVKYLKKLAKEEYDIDFDDVKEPLEEVTEPEPETERCKYELEKVARESIYCECWRKELKELLKVVFDHSSTTEVEMDLSDNVSGSELSVINPPEAQEKAKRFSYSDISISSSTVKSFDFQSSSTSSLSTVCSCGILPTGSVCKCLEGRGKKKHEKVFKGENETSTEHFYKEQNAQVFADDGKDIIYEDTFVHRKQISFEQGLKDEALNNIHFDFYGKKDAIRDEKAEVRMKKRIERYEREGEQSFTEEEVEEEEEDDHGDVQKTLKINKGESISIEKMKKFHISVEGASYEILGDPDGLESLEMKRGEMADKVSMESFREMYTDEITPALQVLPSELVTSESTSEHDSSLVGENAMVASLKSGPSTVTSSNKDFMLIPEEDDVRGISLETLVDEFEDIRSKEFDEQVETRKEEDMARPGQKTFKKLEGIPLCCICRCIVPEGLPCCPCGASTVVEVFKKESMEVYIQSEDDISYRIELFERELPPESRGSVVPSEEEDIDAEMDQLPPIGQDLPPESFTPFSPHLPNVFIESSRPYDLTKEYIDSLRKDSKSIPEECLILFNEAKRQLRFKRSRRGKEEGGEGSVDETDDEEDNEKDAEEIEGEEEDEYKKEFGGRKGKEDFCEEKEEPRVKCFFSDIKLFTPEGVEDWRLTMHTKYKEWFFEGPDIHDDSYYDIAIEEVSEDEYEVDKDLETYFEK